MITWSAILVLQGAEGGVGEPDDLVLVQGYLNMLQRTHRPAPSLHHTLANRLETWLQSMSTPPAIDPDLPHLVFDPSWSLFDQNSMRIASESYYQQTPPIGLPDGENSPTMSHPHNQNLGIQNPQNFANADSWNGYEHPPDSWPSNLLRLFGNAEFQSTDNAENNMQ